MFEPHTCGFWVVAQLARASGLHPESREFESHLLHIAYWINGVTWFKF